MLLERRVISNRTYCITSIRMVIGAVNILQAKMISHHLIERQNTNLITRVTISDCPDPTLNSARCIEALGPSLGSNPSIYFQIQGHSL